MAKSVEERVAEAFAQGRREGYSAGYAAGSRAELDRLKHYVEARDQDDRAETLAGELYYGDADRNRLAELAAAAGLESLNPGS